MSTQNKQNPGDQNPIPYLIHFPRLSSDSESGFNFRMNPKTEAKCTVEFQSSFSIRLAYNSNNKRAVSLFYIFIYYLLLFIIIIIIINNNNFTTHIPHRPMYVVAINL